MALLTTAFCAELASLDESLAVKAADAARELLFSSVSTAADHAGQ